MKERITFLIGSAAGCLDLSRKGRDKFSSTADALEVCEVAGCSLQAGGCWTLLDLTVNVRPLSTRRRAASLTAHFGRLLKLTD